MMTSPATYPWNTSASHPINRASRAPRIPTTRPFHDQGCLARQPQLKIVASPWTAPAWMKENNDWYSKGWGGALLSTNYDAFARYMVKY